MRKHAVSVHIYFSAPAPREMNHAASCELTRSRKSEPGVENGFQGAGTKVVVEERAGQAHLAPVINVAESGTA
jgi:hypothetical protein